MLKTNKASKVSDSDATRQHRSHFSSVLLKPLSTALVAVSIVACVAGSSSSWITEVSNDPDNLNELLVNADDNAVYVSGRDDGLHITSFDNDGAIVNNTTIDAVLNDGFEPINLLDDKLLLVGSTIRSSQIIDATNRTISTLDVSWVPEIGAPLQITGATQQSSNVVLVFGTAPLEKAWIVLLDFSNETSELINVNAVDRIDSLFSHTNIVLSGGTDGSLNTIVSIDLDTDTQQSFQSSTGLALIGEHQGNPVFFNADNDTVEKSDPTGTTLWSYQITEFEGVKGQSVGPDGSTLLWGDASNLNVFTGFNTDQANFVQLSSDGDFNYLYSSGKDSVRVAYKNIKQFADGTSQVTFQGWTGALAGFVVGGSVGTNVPFVVTQRIYHDYITATGDTDSKLTEPVRSETFSRCGLICLNIEEETPGHCNNIDVFDRSGQGLISLSVVCGAEQPDTLAISYY